jgi:hypothetical protein
MSNPFDNVPSSPDAPEAIGKKVVSRLESLLDRDEQLTARREAIIKHEEEITGEVYEALLNDDGTMKDFTHSAEIRNLIDKTGKMQQQAEAAFYEIIKSIPTKVVARLSDDDRKTLASNFRSWKDVFRLYLPSIAIVGFTVGIILMGSIMLYAFAADKKEAYEQRIEQLDRWYDENAEAISFGQFYRENFPKNYNQWYTGQWQRDIVVRDSLRRAYSLDRLKRLYEAED